MRILFAHNGSDLYGASRCLLRLVTRLVKEGHWVCVVLPYDGPLNKELVLSGAFVRLESQMPILRRPDFLGFWGIVRLVFDYPLSVIRWISILRELQPDVLHSNSATVVSPAVAARLCSIPHVWHIRESFTEFSTAWKFLQPVVFLFSSRIVCVSAAIRSEFRPSMQRKVLVIHDGFPISEFEPVSDNRLERFKREWGLDDHTTVGVVGRLRCGRKGQDVFLRAAALVWKLDNQVRFLLIGSSFPGNEDHERQLRLLASELGISDACVFTGDVDDIKAAYAALDISVLPSGTPEPFGGVVIESMAMSIPVVGTNIGGTVEQVVDGSTGFLVPPNQPGEMAERILLLLRDNTRRLAMGAAGRRRFLALFEFEEFFRRIMEVYDEVVTSV